MPHQGLGQLVPRAPRRHRVQPGQADLRALQPGVLRHEHDGGGVEQLGDDGQRAVDQVARVAWCVGEHPGHRVDGLEPALQVVRGVAVLRVVAALGRPDAQQVLDGVRGHGRRGAPAGPACLERHPHHATGSLRARRRSPRQGRVVASVQRGRESARRSPVRVKGSFRLRRRVAQRQGTAPIGLQRRPIGQVRRSPRGQAVAGGRPPVRATGWSGPLPVHPQVERRLGACGVALGRPVDACVPLLVHGQLTGGLRVARPAAVQHVAWDEPHAVHLPLAVLAAVHRQGAAGPGRRRPSCSGMPVRAVRPCPSSEVPNRPPSRRRPVAPRTGASALGSPTLMTSVWS